MRILKAFTFVAVAGALAVGAAQAQTTGFGKTLFVSANGSSAWGEYTNPYYMKFQDVTKTNGAAANWMLPQSGSGTWGPQVDIFCVDLHNNVSNGQVYNTAWLTNLGANPLQVGTYTRSGNLLMNYLAAAYLSQDILNNVGNYAVQNVDSWAIWTIMSGAINDNLYTPGDISGKAAYALAHYLDVNPYEWVVVTDRSAAETSNQGPQEFITHVTPEPATLLLLGTGLMGMLMAAGALRRSAV